MWVNKVLFQTVLDDNKKTADHLVAWQNTCHSLQGQMDVLRAQKAKDDMTIDWMRHRINALEKERAILLMKSSGIALPVPEIVPTRPGTMSIPNFDSMPSFEDVGDEAAKTLGLAHDLDGTLVTQ